MKISAKYFGLVVEP